MIIKKGWWASTVALIYRATFNHIHPGRTHTDASFNRERQVCPTGPDRLSEECCIRGQFTAAFVGKQSRCEVIGNESGKLAEQEER